jgi:hypothetical protein
MSCQTYIHQSVRKAGMDIMSSGLILSSWLGWDAVRDGGIKVVWVGCRITGSESAGRALLSAFDADLL